MSENNADDVEANYIIGLDMGTTTVKVTVIHLDSLHVVEERTDSSDTYFVNNNSYSEQNTVQIMKSLDQCVLSLPERILKRVVGIGVCGQMHGLVCWSSYDRPWNRSNSFQNNINYLEIDSTKVSRHYTWQDNRCDPSFLRSLPQPDSHLSIHTGYGCCTLFSLTRSSPETIEKYNRAGTIADFVVCALCDLDVVQMSPQNAASWGYFNCEKNQWNADVLRDAKFPTRFLPQIAVSGEVAGRLASTWRHIPKGTPVGVALGDLQSYVLAVLDDDSHAVVNISTSAQLVFVAKNFTPSKTETTLAKIVPFFDGKYLYEAAALNGGNAMNVFVTFLEECLHCFGHEIAKTKIWNKLIESSAADLSESELSFKPVFLGERHDPLQRASISNLTSDNFRLTKIFRALCKGLIENISGIIPVGTLKQKGIVKVVATGSALLRNKILQEELEKQFQLPIEYKNSADSPYGAALSMAKKLNKI